MIFFFLGQTVEKFKLIQGAKAWIKFFLTLITYLCNALRKPICLFLKQFIVLLFNLFLALFITSCTAESNQFFLENKEKRWFEEAEDRIYETLTNAYSLEQLEKPRFMPFNDGFTYMFRECYCIKHGEDIAEGYYICDDLQNMSSHD